MLSGAFSYTSDALVDCDSTIDSLFSSLATLLSEKEMLWDSDRLGLDAIDVLSESLIEVLTAALVDSNPEYTVHALSLLSQPNLVAKYAFATVSFIPCGDSE